MAVLRIVIQIVFILICIECMKMSIKIDDGVLALEPLRHIIIYLIKQL